MPALNKVMLMGNVTRALELRYTPAGRAVVDVGLAINEKVKRGERWEEEVLFTEVTFWGKQAEALAQYLHKGDPFFCEGKLRKEEWTDKEGKTQRKTKVTGEGFQFLGSTRRGGAHDERPADATGGLPPLPPGSEPPAPGDGDEIPF